jgi:hypothetical protein
MHDDDLEEWEDADLDFRPDDEIEMVPCPYCRKLVYEEAERCPHCESYISREDAPLRRAPWFALGILLCLGIVVAWIVGC